LVKKVDEGHVGGQINDARIKVKRGSSFANREAQRRVAPIDVSRLTICWIRERSCEMNGRVWRDADHATEVVGLGCLGAGPAVSVAPEAVACTTLMT
jgi:hypothetical protein